MNTTIRLTALALMMSSSIALAAHDGQRGPKGSPAEHLIESLSLDETQATELRALFEAQHDQRGPRGGHHRKPDQAEHAARCAHKAEMDAAIAAILTDAQQTLWQTQRAERDQHRRGPSCEAELL